MKCICGHGDGWHWNTKRDGTIRRPRENTHCVHWNCKCRKFVNADLHQQH